MQKEKIERFHKIIDRVFASMVDVILISMPVITVITIITKNWLELVIAWIIFIYMIFLLPALNLLIHEIIKRLTTKTK